MLVALFDTGATCSLMHAGAAGSLGLTIKPCDDQPISGVEGSFSVIYNYNNYNNNTGHTYLCQVL
jgi:hypothetical protein